MGSKTVEEREEASAWPLPGPFQQASHFQITDKSFHLEKASFLGKALRTYCTLDYFRFCNNI